MKNIIIALLGIGIVGSAIYSLKMTNDNRSLEMQLSGETSELLALRSERSAKIDQIKTMSSQIEGLRSDLSKMQPATRPVVKSDLNQFDPAVNRAARDLYLQRKEHELEVSLHSFFAGRGISEEKWQKYKAAVLESENLLLDAQAEAKQKHLPTKELEAITGNFYSQMRKQLIDDLGQDAYDQVVQYNREKPMRSFVASFSGDMLSPGTTLSGDQMTAMVSILRDNQSGLKRVSESGFLLPDNAMDALSKVLSPDQYNALTHQQAGLNAQSQLNALSRAK